MVVKPNPEPPIEALSNRWPPPQGEWTYADYTRLPDNSMRYEVIEGNLYMSPAPKPRHQRVIAALHGHLWTYLQRHPLGEVFFAPIELILPNLTSPVQPDLLFVASAQRDIVKEDLVEGVPELIVEVLSPSNPGHDRSTKFQAYARAGVQEYWIVDPEARLIDIYVRRGQAYALLGRFGPDEHIRSEVLTEFSVQVTEICSS